MSQKIEKVEKKYSTQSLIKFNDIKPINKHIIALLRCY